MDIGSVVLCGGKSSRMGTQKALLTINGETFLHRTLTQLQDFEEILISANDPALASLCAYPVIPDRYPGCGPMGGLHAALSTCRSGALLAVACDMPCFTAALVRLLLSHWCEDADAVIAMTPDGRYHPLCAIYRKSLAPIFEDHLRSGKCKLLTALPRDGVRFVPVPEDLAPCLKNVNTPEDYLALTTHYPAASG